MADKAKLDDLLPEAAPEPAAPAPARYKMVLPYWDGHAMHKKGAVLPFIPGTQPKNAKPE